MLNLTMLGLVILSVLFNTGAQLALKMGMLKIGHFSFTASNITPVALKAITCPWILFGLLVYIGSVSVWLMVLSRMPVSVAYPMASLGYITSAIAAFFIWGEDLTPTRIAGILVILLGVYLVAKS